MAASTGHYKVPELSKAEYLKRYLSADGDVKQSKGKIKKKRPKPPQKGLTIVDDDIDWKQTIDEEEVIEEDEEEAPVIAEVIDERPEEVKQLEAFRTSDRWRVIGADEKEDSEEGQGHQYPESLVSSRSQHSSPELSSKRRRHDSPDRKTRHDSPDVSPPRRGRRDSPDVSPPRRGRRDSPDVSPPRRGRRDSPDVLPLRQNVPSNDSSITRVKPSSSSSSKKRSPDSHRSPVAKRAQKRCDSDSDRSPPRKKPQKGAASDSDQSPPRMRSKTSRASNFDRSPLRKRRHNAQDSEEDLSPPRRPGPSHGPRMLSGGTAGLVSVDVLRKEQDENRRGRRDNRPLEDESRNAQTLFREEGKRRNLDSEREEQRRKAEEKAAKDGKYAEWGKGLAQTQMHQQKLEDAVLEAQKPLARHRDDEDLDQMLREQERDGDPMAAMLRRKKEHTSKTKDKPRYKGPVPPPNRFNLLPGYRWDGVNRSNGFEKKRYMRMADKKADQDAAYKWSVEDM